MKEALNLKSECSSEIRMIFDLLNSKQLGLFIDEILQIK